MLWIIVYTALLAAFYCSVFCFLFFITDIISPLPHRSGRPVESTVYADHYIRLIYNKDQRALINYGVSLSL